MFYHFLLSLQEYFSFLRLFKYITFRSIYAAVTALLFVLIFGKIMIKWLQKLKFREEIKELGPKHHSSKAGTPTMGGLIILAAIIGSVALWGNFSNSYFVVLVIATILFGYIGFVDDYMKSVLKKKNGMPARIKFIGQIFIAGAVAAFIYYNPSRIIYFVTTKSGELVSMPVSVSSLYVPFISNAVGDFCWVWMIFAALVIVGSSNAVNLTDGLDGLAVGSVIIVAVTMGIMTYLTGHSKIAAYLGIPFVTESAELTVFLAAMIGACLGFLWFNSNPAAVFMGDTGSLSLGGIIGIVAIMIKKEILLFIVGGVFVLETFSVIIQVVSYKSRKKRVFKMAPIHHHFELSGWPEQKVVVRFWILGIILAIIGLSALKIL